MLTYICILQTRLLKSTEPELVGEGDEEVEEEEEWWRWEMDEKYLLAGRWVADLGGLYIIVFAIMFVINYLLTGCCYCMYVSKQRKALADKKSGPTAFDEKPTGKEDEKPDPDADMTTRHLYIGAGDLSSSHSPYHKKNPDDN